MRMISFFLLVVCLCTQARASCLNHAQPVQYSRGLDCLLSEWRETPEREQFLRFINALFYAYLTDGNNPGIKKFFDGLRMGASPFDTAIALEKELIDRYARRYASSGETASLGLIPSQDAKLLFLLSQPDTQSLPEQIFRALQLTLYEEIETLYALHFSTRHEFGIFPATEYSRLLEILQDFSVTIDPYLQALRQYYQGIVLINLGDSFQGFTSVMHSRDKFIELLSSAQEKLSRKRILHRLADTELVLGNQENAERAYVLILKIDPQEWSALIDLSKLLYEGKKCSEPGIWVEASIKSGQELFDVVIHCGNRKLPEEEFETEPPVLAAFRSAGLLHQN